MVPKRKTAIYGSMLLVPDPPIAEEKEADVWGLEEGSDLRHPHTSSPEIFYKGLFHIRGSLW